MRKIQVKDSSERDRSEKGHFSKKVMWKRMNLKRTANTINPVNTVKKTDLDGQHGQQSPTEGLV